MLQFTALAAGNAVLDLQSVRLNGGNLVLTPLPVPGADGTDAAVTIAAAPAKHTRSARGEAADWLQDFLRTGAQHAGVYHRTSADGEQRDAAQRSAGAAAALDWSRRYWDADEALTKVGASRPAQAQANASEHWTRGFVSNLAKPIAASPNAAISISLL